MMALVILLPLPDFEAESDMASDEGWDAAGGMAAGPWMAAADDWVGDGKWSGVGRTTVAGGSLDCIPGDCFLSSVPSNRS